MGKRAKTVEEIRETETFNQKIGNMLKVVHFDSGGRGDHLPKVKLILDALGLTHLEERVENVNAVLVRLEKDRCDAILRSQKKRTGLLKEDYANSQRRVRQLAKNCLKLAKEIEDCQGVVPSSIKSLAMESL